MLWIVLDEGHAIQSSVVKSIRGLNETSWQPSLWNFYNRISFISMVYGPSMAHTFVF